MRTSPQRFLPILLPLFILAGCVQGNSGGNLTEQLDNLGKVTEANTEAAAEAPPVEDLPKTEATAPLLVPPPPEAPAFVPQAPQAEPPPAALPSASLPQAQQAVVVDPGSGGGTGTGGAGGGTDTITFSGGTDTIIGGSGTDTITFGSKSYGNVVPADQIILNTQPIGQDTIIFATAPYNSGADSFKFNNSADSFLVNPNARYTSNTFANRYDANLGDTIVIQFTVGEVCLEKYNECDAGASGPYAKGVCSDQYKACIDPANCDMRLTVCNLNKKPWQHCNHDMDVCRLEDVCRQQKVACVNGGDSPTACEGDRQVCTGKIEERLNTCEAERQSCGAYTECNEYFYNCKKKF